MVDLNVYLPSIGIGLSGWGLSEALAISPDGRTIMGTGAGPDGLYGAWIVTIPSPGAAGLLAAGVLAARRRPRH
jgi:hypothetical protein